jgi:hypothetical protein
MKKQLLILATVFATVVFVSCSKEKIDGSGVPEATNEEIATAFSSGGRPAPKLEARFEFDGNLKEIAGRVPAGIPTTTGAAKYRKDRKGNEQRALLFDESYGVNLFNIPQQTNTSLSAWLYVEPVASVNNMWPRVKVVSGVGPTISYQFVPPFWYDPPGYIFKGGVTIPNYSASGLEPNFIASDDLEKGVWAGGWHHVVVTYDGNTIKLYLDGNLVDTMSFEGGIRPSPQAYKLGFTTLTDYFWKGALDDLRFYSGTLSSSDVQKLYNF